MTYPFVAVSKPVAFSVSTVHGGWSWRCMKCNATRNGLRFDEFAESMRAHVADRHATAIFTRRNTTFPRTT